MLIALLFVTCVFCLDLFAVPLGVIGRLCSLIVALPRRLLYYFTLIAQTYLSDFVWKFRERHLLLM